MLISGGGFVWPCRRVMKAIDGRWCRTSFHIFGRRKRPSQFRNKTQRVAMACYNMLRNALAQMTHCLGHPAIVASIGPVIPSANLCKVLHNFVDICIRKQNFAELTPVHRIG
jgi:hypothetical protein